MLAIVFTLCHIKSVVFFACSSHALIIFEGEQVGGVVMWHTAATTALMFVYFSFLFETFPNALIISWNILIITFIDYVDNGRWLK